MLGNPELDTVLQVGSHKSQAVQKIVSHSLLASFHLMHLRMCFWAVSTHCWVVSNFSSTLISHFQGLLSSHSPPSLYLCLGWPSPAAGLACGLVELCEVGTDPPLPPVRVPSMLSLPSCLSIAPHRLVLSANLQSPLSISLTKVLTQCQLQSWPLRNATCHYLHFNIELLTATAWVQPSGQSPVQWVVHLSNLCYFSLGARMSGGTVWNVQVQVDDVSSQEK